jgi:hypothetical protein
METDKLQSLLHSLYDDLTDSAKQSQKLAKSLREHSYRKKRRLTPEAAEIFEMRSASIRDIVNFWLPLWTDEKRVLNSGRTIRLGEEAPLLGEAPETELDIYDLCKRMYSLFIH